MPLWGKTDALASQPKYVSRTAYFDSTKVSADNDTLDIITANTGFATGDAVLYSINGGTVIGGLVDATTYYVRNVGAGTISLYDTYANAIALSGTTGRLNLTGAGVGTHTLKRVGSTANPFGDRNYNGHQVLFVDRVESRTPEARARGLRSPGWWVYRTWTNGDGSVQHSAELLIAMDVVPGDSGDSNDDTILPDRTIVILTQPQDDESASGSEVVFAVTVDVDPVATPSYLWQVSTDDGDTWGTASGTNNLATYTIADNTGLDGNLYRVVVSADGATSVTSSAALLTESA